MKVYLILVCSVFSFWSIDGNALPILNRNSPGAEKVILFPDSKDDRLFYYAPNTLVPALNAQGVPLFLYMEYKEFFARKAIVQAVLRPGFHDEDLMAAQARVKAIYSNATFAALPFLSSEIEISSELAPLVDQSDCNHMAGNVSDDQNCILKLSARGRTAIAKALRSSGGLSIRFSYKVSGVLEDGDGHYQSKELDFSVSGRMGGSELKGFPNLFLDPWGNPIYFRND